MKNQHHGIPSSDDPPPQQVLLGVDAARCSDSLVVLVLDLSLHALMGNIHHSNLNQFVSSILVYSTN